MAELSVYRGDPNLSGGRDCLNFANTVGGRRPDRPREYLHTYSDLVAWSRHAGILTDTAARRLVDEAERRPAEATQVLARALGLREAIYRIFSAIAAGGAPIVADLAILNDALPEALARLQVTPAEDGFTWNWRADEAALDSMLWPVVCSAGELLTSTELARVRECDGETCSWLFLDTSKNRSRRWCDMRDCGNRAKARRHYSRKRLVEMARPETEGI
ncbi:MAG: ABATE domain-containing protein [Chloroflexi bacterium]|nr:ABATE domain-containing protein [Chloroflexota bacterium]